VASRPALSKYAWQRLRARALQRDGNRCRHCGSTAKLSVHHLVRPQDGGRDELSNLATLCDRCHRLTHKAMRRQRITTPARGAFVDDIVSPDPLGLEYPSPISEKNGSRPEDGNYEDDPEAGVYWGPKQPNGMHTRWSRPWFDWRSERSLKNEALIGGRGSGPCVRLARHDVV
jgi:hypothetical protein